MYTGALVVREMKASSRRLEQVCGSRNPGSKNNDVSVDGADCSETCIPTL